MTSVAHMRLSLVAFNLRTQTCTLWLVIRFSSPRVPLPAQQAWMPLATLGSWLIIGCLFRSLRVVGCRLTVETRGRAHKLSQRRTCDLRSVTKTICPYPKRESWLLGRKQTFGVPLCGCHRDPRGMCPSLLWKSASGSLSKAGWQTSISSSTLTVAKRTTHTEETSFITNPSLSVCIFHSYHDSFLPCTVSCFAAVSCRMGVNCFPVHAGNFCYRQKKKKKKQNALMCQDHWKSVAFPLCLSPRAKACWH